MPQSFNLEWRGDQIKAGVRDGAAAGLRAAAEHLLGEAQALVPHETGHLERSGRASVDETSLEAVVSFDTVYAVRQHEETGWQHKNGRQAKYLETPLGRESTTMGELIAAQIRRSMR